MKWMYKENAGVLAKGDEINQLAEYFTQDRPNDLRKFKHITFHQAINLISKAKESVKEEDEKESEVSKVAEIEAEEKPRRKRRTKAEIEADNLGK